MNQTEKLLRAALEALNSIPNRGLHSQDFKDTYSLAKAISDHFRDSVSAPKEDAFRKALEDIAGEEEPRPALNGTTAEELRNIARRALAVSRPSQNSEAK